MKKYKIKTGDTVKVITGENKGQEGKVLKVLYDSDKVIVESVNMIKKHLKPSAQNPQGGIQEKEAPIHISNVALTDKNGNPTRVRYEIQDDKKVRVSTKTKEVIS
ncbi:50S ribosomal protein L24 [Mesohalobacter halotolerans]|uniref:Large ribosomal subunit protein uL24 n=1 Tax=Mesohalobacter halotolerans TaxID=1883405 RepID=A0A4U5TNM6_9FLAO|nr:50S ribosomal protein L24 [Mesohalobacter halotolerans]TKS55639.1 50S ribosomal protein L24 [Mesohalobacter halotolerans]